MSVLSRPQGSTVPGAVETLGSGFSYVVRYPGLMALPVGLDLFLWLGPRLSIAPVARVVAGRVAALGPSLQRLSDQGGAGQAGDMDYVQSMQHLGQSLEASGEALNLFSMASGGLVGMPSLAAVAGSPPLPMGYVRPVITVAHALVFLVLIPILLAVGVVVGAVYLEAIAQMVREGRWQTRTVLWRLPWHLLNVLFLMGGLLLLGIGLSIPLLLGLALLGQVSAMLMSLAIVTLWIGGLWIVLFLYFTLDAIFLSDVHVIQAVVNSVALVRHNFQVALNLIMLSVIISVGMSYVWSALGDSPGGLLVSIVGNAFVGTGLIAASMVFYRDRTRALVLGR